MLSISVFLNCYQLRFEAGFVELLVKETGMDWSEVADHEPVSNFCDLLKAAGRGSVDAIAAWQEDVYNEEN